MPKLLLAILVGVADRVRGGFPEGKRPKWVKYLAMATVGPILTYMVSDDWRAILIAVVVGHVIWRQDNGYKGQWVDPTAWRGWRSFIGPLRWGGLSAIVLSLITAWFDKSTLVYLVALPVSTLAGMAISTKLPAIRSLELRHAWPWSELITLTLSCGVAICIKLLVTSHWPSLLT